MPPKKKFEVIIHHPKKVLSRIFEATKTTTLEELSEILQCSSSRISGAMRIRRIPMSWLVALHATQGISPLWVITGLGDAYCPQFYFDLEKIFTLDPIELIQIWKTYANTNLYN